VRRNVGPDKTDNGNDQQDGETNFKDIVDKEMHTCPNP
jgi:hypothetical protein